MPKSPVMHSITHVALVWLGLVAAIAIARIVATRTHIPPPILLVLMGVGLAFVPGLPLISLNPQLVLLLFLPLLVYASAYAMSWRSFRRNLQTIALLVIGGVTFTAVGVAIVVHYWIGLAWPLAFVLGAVVSPTDEVAAIAIAARLAVPRRIITIIEGEGLVNDTSALILFRFALAAALTGAPFSFSKATGEFAMIAVGEVLFGLAVGWLMARLRAWADDTQVEVLLSLLTPFVAYWPAAHLGGSGVLATVAAGLYIGWNSPSFIPYGTRLQSAVFWDIVTDALEGLLFLLTGLQIRTIVSRLSGLLWGRLLIYAAVVTAVVVVLRFAWVFLSTYLPRLIPVVRARSPNPPWQQAFLVSFAGIRGAISLAAALAIPLGIAGHVAYSPRDLIVFITFCVIVVTLVGQGLTLPFVIQWLGLGQAGRREREQEWEQGLSARVEGVKEALARVDRLAEEHRYPNEILEPLRRHHSARLTGLERLRNGEDAARRARQIRHARREIIEAERRRIYALRERGEISDEIRRDIEHELDLEEARVRPHGHGSG